MVRRQGSNESGRRLLSILHTNAVRGSEIVKQALSFARGVEGEHIPLQPTHLIKEIIKILADTVPKSIEITFSIEPELWAISGDATQLHQVLMKQRIEGRRQARRRFAARRENLPPETLHGREAFDDCGRRVER